MPKIILQPLFAAGIGLAARSCPPSLSPPPLSPRCLSKLLGVPGQTRERCSGQNPSLAPAPLPTALLAWFTQAIRDLHKELKQKSLQCDRKNVQDQMHNRRAAIAYTYAGKNRTHSVFEIQLHGTPLLQNCTKIRKRFFFFLIEPRFMMCDWKKKSRFKFLSLHLLDTETAIEDLTLFLRQYSQVSRFSGHRFPASLSAQSTSHSLHGQP